MNNVKRHIYNVKNAQLVHDLPATVNNGVISLFHKGFVFMKFCKNKTLAKILEFTVAKSIVQDL